MAGIPLQKIGLKLIDLFVKRIIFLVIIIIALFYMTIDRHVLKVKTLNFLMPDAQDIRMFNEHPDKMDREHLKSILIYYKKVCDFQSRDPEGPAPCSFAAYAYYYLGNTKKAVSLYEKAVIDNQYFFWFHYNLGAIYFNEGRYDKAAGEFSRAVNMPASNSMYFLTLTKTYKDVALLLKIGPETLGSSLMEGYNQANELMVISKMLLTNPAMKTQIGIDKVKLRLF